MSYGAERKLTMELKAAIDTMCAAVESVAALLLSTYFLNDRPAHMLNKHKVLSSYIWRPVQRPTPFVVRQVCYLGGKIFTTFIKLQEVVLRGELCPLLKTTLHYGARGDNAAGQNLSDSNVSCAISCLLWYIYLRSYSKLIVCTKLKPKHEYKLQETGADPK